MAGDHPTRISRAAIQTNAVAGGRTESGQAAIIGDEVVQRVFGGHPALQRVTVQLHPCLVGRPDGLGQRFAFGNQICA